MKSDNYNYNLTHWAWSQIIIIIIEHLLKAGCQLLNGGRLCDEIVWTCNYGLPIQISKFVCHWQLLWQWQWQWRSSCSYSSFNICAISCLSLGGPKGRLGGSFVSTPWSPSVLDTCKYKYKSFVSALWSSSVALFYRRKYKNKSFVSTPRSQYSIFLYAGK